MLSPALVEEVRRLLAEGRFSQRRIAVLTGVSRTTVSNIARGRRPDYPQRACDDELGLACGPLGRCPGCGGRVYLPCRLCHVRAVAARQAVRATAKGCAGRGRAGA